MIKVLSNTMLACLLSFSLVASLEAAILGGGLPFLMVYKKVIT